MLRKIVLIALFVLLGTAPLAAQEAPAPPFQRMDVFGLEWVEDPQIAPDGSRIVYVRRGMDIMTDRRTAALWMMNADGTNHVKLTDRDANESSPRWSPDGTRIAFTSSDEADGSEVYVHWVGENRTAKITQLANSPGGLAWSPDGTRLAFTMHVDAPAPQFVTPPSKPDGADWADPPRVETRLNHEADGVGILDYGFDHVFVVRAEGGPARQITSGDYHHSSIPVWTPDGEQLILSANRHENWTRERNNSELYAVSVDDGTITPLTDRFGPDVAPRVSPDGAAIAYLGYDDAIQTYQVNRLYMMNADGSDAQEIETGLDRSINAIAWDENGDGLYIQYNDEGVGKLAHVGQEGGTMTSVADSLGGGSIGRPYVGGVYFSVADDGTLAVNRGSPYRPSDLALVRRESGTITPLTALNNELLGRRTLGQVEAIRYTSTKDGRDLHGWVVTPPGYDPDRPYPLLVEIHGGPISHYGPYFSPEIQLYAADGYVVFYPNARGSTSYGEEFGNLLYNDFSGGEYQDVIDGVDRLIADGVVSEDSLYITGGSAGGTTTAWVVGQTDRFRAAAAQKPVINWISKTLAADNWYGYANYRYPGWAWENPMEYWDVSPISLAGNVETPTLVIVGDADLRTPTWEAKQFYHALKQRGVETAYVEVPGAYHFISNRPSQLITKIDHVLAWFDRYR
jgi:dipeptidyl aminopeptidase/acylaminoacyl peptidase